MRGLVAVSALLLAAALLAAGPPAAAQTVHLELVGVPGRADMPVPLNCTVWHELHPNHCAPRHQDDYADDGDGFVSVCDRLVLDGVSYHIEWIGPTYYLEGMPGRPGKYLEPMEPGRDGSPVCETWHEVYPSFCIAHHVDGWEDNGDGFLGPCDMILLGGELWHLQEVGFNIIVTPESPVEHGTWGRIKDIFRTLFGS